jgi:hypothetical protein
LRAAAIALLLLAACSDDTPQPRISPIPSNLGDFELSSPAFAEGEPIPEIYSCNGENVSPPLEWTGVPDGAAELMLTMLDPDAPSGVFTHWTVYAIDPSSQGTPEGSVPEGALQGTNDTGADTYAGPCPPSDESHRYVFTLAALAEPSGLDPGAAPGEVDAVLVSAVATTTLTGEYPGETR